ncbi:MAG: 4Fe-4S binding protein [candidate division KSB1 bacterium]|nr:4Fe-4S binding protein [candidate division KSB1 bacterium]MDZ7358931.1 4Fe-4S binding protein [candidate division KSB1 bacterium]MDZ7400279.1 4Fe-4S binding protein [candidate division KSB1 bacterium]
MNFVTLLPIILSCLLMAAHFSRANQHGLAISCLLLPLLLLVKRRWVARVIQVLLLLGALEWITTTLRIVQMRQAHGVPWMRLVIILGSVALFTALSALVFESRKLKQRYRPVNPLDATSSIAFLATALLLSILQTKLSSPILLLERFVPTMGWLEVLGLSLYAGVIMEKMINPHRSAQWRQRIWLLFSIVFFSQLIFGLFGIEKLLMTGRLHLPIPAMIVAGPIFRGERFFMLILFLSTIVLVGPAWCSYLCYIGSWDNLAARSREVSRDFFKGRRSMQAGMLIIVIVAARLLRWLGASMMLATLIGAIFGLVGVGMMILWSRKKGVMTHCLTYCPIGFLATTLGKLSPFRIRIKDGCTKCRACTSVCRYDALQLENIIRQRPASSCTLCGDCIGSCKGKFLEYRLFRFAPENARVIFLVMAVVLHAVFMGVARI